MSRATESALQKNRKALTLAASAKKEEGSSASATPSPEKSELPAPTGKPKRVRPISTGNSPAVSLVAEDASLVAAKQPIAALSAPFAAAASFSRPRAKKLLQGSLCFAVCAFDTTVPVPLRSVVSDYDSLLVAIHNQVCARFSVVRTGILPMRAIYPLAPLHSTVALPCSHAFPLVLLTFAVQFFLGFSQPDNLQLTSLTIEGEVAYTRAIFELSILQGSSACVILNASCSEVSDSLPIWSLESQCFFWVREYNGDKYVQLLRALPVTSRPHCFTSHFPPSRAPQVSHP